MISITEENKTLGTATSSSICEEMIGKTDLKKDAFLSNEINSSYSIANKENDCQEK
jgi:hypothetical protein